VKGLLDRADEARLAGDYRTGCELAREALALAGTSGDSEGQAGALHLLATQALQWEIETDPAKCSEVEVTFTPISETATRVDLAHRHLSRHGDGWKGMAQAVGGPDGCSASIDSLWWQRPEPAYGARTAWGCLISASRDGAGPGFGRGRSQWRSSAMRRRRRRTGGAR